jgi:hypothetical protein
MRHRPRPNSATSSIVPLVSTSGHLTSQEESVARIGDGLRAERITRKAWAMRRWILAGGAVAAAIPAGPGLAQTIEGRPGALPLLVLAAVVAIVTVVLNAVVVVYQARQETLRKEIEHRSVDALAAALARCIDDAHTKTRNLPAARELEETAQVRSSARQVLSDMAPHIAALLERDPRRDATRPNGTSPSPTSHVRT